MVVCLKRMFFDTFYVLFLRQITRKFSNLCFQFSYGSSPRLQDFVSTDQIKLRFVDMLVTDGTAVTNRFYSLRQFAAFGRCRCHGNAAQCHQVSPGTPLQCAQCQNARHGKMCQKCFGFSGAEFPDNSTCPDCTCNGQSETCTLSTSGGVECHECRGRAAGASCEMCQNGFYRAAGNAREICVPCNCYKPGSISTKCSRVGQCECVQGRVQK